MGRLSHKPGPGNFRESVLFAPEIGAQGNQRGNDEGRDGGQHDPAEKGAVPDPFLQPAAASEYLEQGKTVYTIGSPSGLRHTVTSGIISGFRELREQPLIQIDAPINPGNSGGPLINAQGRVLGINTMILNNTEGIGFAIPFSRVRLEFPGMVLEE